MQLDQFLAHLNYLIGGEESSKKWWRMKVRNMVVRTMLGEKDPLDARASLTTSHE
jgi:hypothetical protein